MGAKLGLYLCWVLLIIWPARAQEAPLLRIQGLGSATLGLSAADFKTLKRQTIEDKRTVTRGGEARETTVRYGGVLLADLLEHAGIGKLEPRAQRRSAIFAIASDNYQAAFSWGEVFNSEAGARILVIDERDGKPLDAVEGPLSLAVFSDQRFGPRHVKWLNQIKVVTGVPP
jgi:hypothetical protein